MSTEYANLGFRVDSGGLVTADQRLKSVTNSGKQTDKQMMGLSKSVGLVSAAFVALGGAMSTRELIQYSDSWNNLNSQLKQVTNSEKELIAVRSQLLDVSRSTRTDLESTIGLYTVLDRATSKLGVSTQEQIDITKTMNNMFLASGKSASETAGAIRQLSQGLESGALRGDEFNSVSEGAPRILDAISNSTGIARGELRAFAATGGITAKILVDALKDYQDEAQRAADLTGMTFSQGLQIANTNMTEFAGKSRAVAGTVNYLSGSVVSMSEVLVDNVQYVEAYFGRFGAYANDIEDASNIIGSSFAEIVNSSAETFPILAQNSETVFDQIIQGFKDLPDNIRAFIKILTVELAYLVDVGLAYGKSFAEVLGVQFGALIDKSAIWGKQLWNNLNPFDDAIDFEGDIARIEKLASDMSTSIIDSAVARAEVVRSARLSSINSILQERDASISAYKTIKDGIDSAIDSAVDLTQKQSALFSGFKEVDETPKWISETKTDLESLINQVDNFGGAWTRTGNVIADSMGGAVSILDDFASKMQSIEKLQAGLTNERKEYADGTTEAIKIDESLAKLQQESASAQIGAIGQTIGLSSQLFKENSKERKALHALEMGFMAVEIAMAAEKAVVNAVNAVATQGQGDPYTAFGRIASMIGIMGGVLAAAGIAFSGGSGGGGYEAPTGGAGAVLGDSSAQSSSIRNASERLEDIQTDQLSELMAIRQSMSQLNSGIQNLAKSFITGLDFNSTSSPLQNSNFLDTKGGSLLRDVSPLARAADFVDKLTGGVLGLGGVVDKIFGGFSGKKQKLIDSGITFVSQTMQDVFDSGQLDADMFQVIETTKKKFWGLSKSKSTKTETSSIGGAITSQMGDIFGFIGDTVVGAAESLGLDAKHIITTGLETLSLGDALNNFVIDIGNVSFADKTGEEIQKELESIFSQQADLMSEYLVPSIKEYQQIGEGAFETLQRVAYEQAVFNDSLERTGLNLSSLSSVMQIDVAQSIITLTGGLEQFSELSNSFFESFFSESEQLAYLEKSLTEAFGGLGLSMVDSREGFKDLLTGIDITTEAGQELYASLLQLVPSMDSYLSALEKEEEERKQARIGFLEDEKSLINSSISSLSSLISNINNELGQAYTVQEALAAARRGDFDIAKKMTGQRVMASDFADSISLARAKAIEENRLFEISSLASAEKSDLERQVELLDKQIEAIQNGADDQVSAILDLGEIVNNGNNDIIRAIMTPSSNSGTNNLMSDIPSTSNSISKSLEGSKQQAANVMQQVEIMNREVVKNTKTTAKILQKIELNGVRVLQ